MPDEPERPPVVSPLNCSHCEKEPPDLVGEELGDHAHIWRADDRVAKVDDQERIGNWNRGLDNLALFAGLFSAVTTAFIIQLQNDTRPDYAELTFRVLNATAAGQPFVQGGFVIDSSVRITNYLWISSLMLSLIAALIAIMGKDWIAMYASRPVCNPRQWAEMRTYRLLCVERWYMAAVIASAPVLLHLSLVLFAAGLVLFFSPDRLTQRLALGLSMAAGALYCVTVVSSIVFSGSPFKSPATQAVRGAISALLVLLRNAPWHKLQSVSQLGQAVLFRAQLLPIYIASLDQLRHSQRWRIRIHLGRLRHRHQSLRETLGRPMREIREVSATLLLSLSLRIHGLPALCHRRMRILSRWLHNRDIPSYAEALQVHLRESLLSTRWTDVSIAPSPALLARAISLFNDGSPTPEALHVTIVALGDMAIGSDVAPLISPDLQTRIGDEIRQRWHTADLYTFSRYILADSHIFPMRTVNFERALIVFDRVMGDPSLRSESLWFAYARSNLFPINYHDISLFCPDIVTQPRAMQYLLPHLAVDARHSPCVDALILLASRCWDPTHQAHSFDLEGTLIRILSPDVWKEFVSQTKSRYGNQSGLLELLTFLFVKALSPPEPIHALIIRTLETAIGYRSQPCLVYAFGTVPTWSARPWTSVALFNFPHSIPLLRYRFMKWDCSDTPPATENDHSFEFALSRIVIEILTSNNLTDSRGVLQRHDDDEIQYLTLELGIRCLHTQLCHSRSLQPPEAKAELIRLILEKTVFNNSTISERYGPDTPWPPERSVLNILTIIARHLARMLGAPGTFCTGAHLFALFSFSETKDSYGTPIFWELGAYLGVASARISDRRDDDPGADVSMRRLETAICALQPFCMARDDLRAAWESLGLAADPYKNDPYWDCEVGPFFSLAEGREGPKSVEVDARRLVDEEQMTQATPEYYALQCLDRSMR